MIGHYAPVYHRDPDIHEISRRSLAALAAGGFGVALTACGGDDEGTAAASRVTVSLSIPTQSLNFSQEMAEGFQYGVGGIDGVSADVRGPEVVNPPAQLQMFREATAASGAGASVFATNPQLFANPLAEAARKGIPLVAVDNPPLPASNVGLWVGNDNVELGRTMADQILADLPEGTTGGTIVIGTSTKTAIVLAQRAVGIAAEFRSRIPGVKVLGPYETKPEVDANRAAWGSLIRATPDALAFVGTGDADALSLADWQERTTGTWVAGGFDLEPQALLAVKRGQFSLVSPEHYLKGAIAGRLLARRAKRGTPLPQGWIRTPGLGITRANVDEILQRQSAPTQKQAWFAAQVDEIVTAPETRPIPTPGR